MSHEPIWLSTREVIDLNATIVEAKGEHHALLFVDKLEGALNRPKQKFYYASIDDVLLLAVYYMEAIGLAHAFEQGNKRTAYTAGALFLYNNGYLLNTPQPADTHVANEFEKVVVNQMSPEDFAEFIEGWVVPTDDDIAAMEEMLSSQYSSSAAEIEALELYATVVDETLITEMQSPRRDDR